MYLNTIKSLDMSSEERMVSFRVLPLLFNLYEQLNMPMERKLYIIIRQHRVTYSNPFHQGSKVDLEASIDMA